MIKKLGFAALGVVVLVVAVWYGVFWRAETSHLKAAKAQLAQVTAQVQADQATVAALQVEAKEAVKDKPLYTKLVGLLPYGPSLDQLYTTINQAAGSAKVQLASVGVPAPAGWGTSAASSSASLDGAQLISVTAQVRGSTSQVLKFITAVDNSNRLYVVTSFTLSAVAGPTTLQIYGFYQSATATDPVFPGSAS